MDFKGNKEGKWELDDHNSVAWQQALLSLCEQDGERKRKY